MKRTTTSEPLCHSVLYCPSHCLKNQSTSTSCSTHQRLNIKILASTTNSHPHPAIHTRARLLELLPQEPVHTHILQYTQRLGYQDSCLKNQSTYTFCSTHQRFDYQHYHQCSTFIFQDVQSQTLEQKLVQLTALQAAKQTQ